MRPVEFSSEQIVEAGQGLQASGRNITGFALRQKIGGGNPSRLKQVWDDFVSSKAVTKAEPVAELPVEVAEELAAVTRTLTERLAALAVELNDKAVKAAERRVSEVIRTAGEQREQAERELADASQTVEDLETRLDEALSAAEAMAKRLADSQAVNQAQAVELAQLHERLAQMDQATKVATGDRDQARTELASIKDRADAAREEAAKLRGQVEALQAQNSELVRALGKRKVDPSEAKA